MIDKIKLEKNKRFWSLVIFIPLTVAILWVLLGAFSLIMAQTTFDDDFNAYDTGALYGQGIWLKTYTYGANVIDDPVFEGARGVNMCSTFGSANITTQTITPATTGTIYWYLRFLLSSSDSIQLADNVYAGVPILKWAYVSDEVIFSVFNGASYVEQSRIDYDPGAWYKFGATWNSTLNQYSFYIVDEWTETFEHASFSYAVDTFIMSASCPSAGKLTYIDYINSSGEPPYVEPKIWGTDPASEAEITDLETSFEFGWEGLEDWDTISVAFQNRSTGIFTDAKEYIIETVSPSGSVVLSLENFNFDRNGIYYFYGVATRQVIEVLEGMYLTGRYSYDWSEDLVDPEFWYTINIEGFSEIFEMSGFEGWYSEISKFATPTDMFVGIVGFFEPIFNKIGEFGNRIEDYFNLNEVYSQGYGIGKTIPYFTYFVGQVSLLLGGFPILKWLSIAMLILVGFFVFRLILKFIPGLG